MNFEMPSQEQPKSETELLREEIRKTEAELAEMPKDAPEYGFLNEKLRSYESQLAKLEVDMIEDMTDQLDPEKPELRTQESYGVTKESQLQKDIEYRADEIRRLEEERKRNAS